MPDPPTPLLGTGHLWTPKGKLTEMLGVHLYIFLVGLVYPPPPLAGLPTNRTSTKKIWSPEVSVTPKGGGLGLVVLPPNRTPS